MPPWGEVAAHKESLNNIPVLNEEEIKQLVDWLFSNLQGGQVIKNSKDVLKWQYAPEDVIEELIKEGNQLKGKKIDNPSSHALLLNLPKGEGLLASLKPTVVTNQAPSKSYVEAIFEKKTEQNSETEPNSYYIRKEYYTPENIEAGRQFFELNCAVCHGTEADGRGIRAEYMQDAKPRMLINLDWLQSRDDLRLLQSIKYGVPGTAMTPWGDLTSSLQRLQLVIFIRSLSQKHMEHYDLSSLLYQTFDTSLVALNKARVKEYADLSEAKTKYEAFVSARKREYGATEENKEKTKSLLESYEKELEALTALKKREEIDNLIINMEKELISEKEIYQRLGNAFLVSLNNESDVANLMELIAINKGRYAFENDKLTADFHKDKEQTRHQLSQAITDTLDRMIQGLQKKKVILHGKIYSLELQGEINEVESQIANLNKLKEILNTGLNEAAILQKNKKIYPNNLKNWNLSLAKASGFDLSKMGQYYNIDPF